MPQTIYYFYQIETVDRSGFKSKIDCGPYQMKAYDFSAVSRKALCYAEPGLTLKYARREVDDSGRYTGEITACDYIVGPKGEWMDLAVSNLTFEN